MTFLSASADNDGRGFSPIYASLYKEYSEGNAKRIEFTKTLITIII